MRLSKTERIYKKRLFAYLKIKNRKKQKGLTAALAKSDIIKECGFVGVYKLIKHTTPALLLLALQVLEILKDLAFALACILKRASEESELTE